MDPPQLGESSRSPQRQRSHTPEIHGNETNGHVEGVEDRMEKLILGNWPVYPPKHVHPSHDLISLLHLDGLYNTYVRPFADNIGPDDEGKPGEDGAQVGQKRKRPKRAKMDKGYLHLIDDCIDPTPMGEKKDNMSIIPLIPDLLPLGQGQPPPDFGNRPEMLSMDLFRNARLEAGQTVDGYEPGNKLGVAAEEEKRQKKRANRVQALQPTPATVSSPALPSYATPGTPGPAINPPRPPFTINSVRRGTQPYRPGTPGTPYGPGLGTNARPPGTPYGAGMGTPIRPSIGTPRAGLPMRPMTHGTPGTPRAGLPVRPTAGFAPGTPRLGGPMRPVGTPGGGQTPGQGQGTPRFPSGMPGKRPGEPLPHLNIKRSKPGGASRSASPRPNSAGLPGQQQGQQGRPGMGKQSRGGTAGI